MSSPAPSRSNGPPAADRPADGAAARKRRDKPDADEERPPICPACGVTMGIIVDEDGATRYACLECGFSDETTTLSVSDDRPRYSEG